jgi:hypothetical protein
MPASVCLTRKIRAGNGAAKHEWKNSFDNYTCQHLSLSLSCSKKTNLGAALCGRCNFSMRIAPILLVCRIFSAMPPNEDILQQLERKMFLWENF